MRRKEEHPARVAEPMRECCACNLALPSTEFEIVARNRLAVICGQCTKQYGGYRGWQKHFWSVPRECTRCHTAKVPGDFYESAKNVCKLCWVKYGKERALVRDALREVWSEKECSACNSTLPSAAFYPSPAGAGGLTSECRACTSKRAKSQTPTWIASDNELLICAECKLQLFATEFKVSKRNRGGRETMCLQCSRKYACEWVKASYRKDKTPFVNRRHRRRELEKHGDGVTEAQWDEILELFDNRCAYCLVQDEKLEIDHVAALTRGGLHAPENTVPACRTCNVSKGKKLLLSIFEPHLLIAQRMVG